MRDPFVLIRAVGCLWQPGTPSSSSFPTSTLNARFLIFWPLFLDILCWMDIDDESTIRGESVDDFPEHDTPTVTRSTVITKYREVWKEFYDWEQTECTHLIKSIILVDDSISSGDDITSQSQRRALGMDYEFVSPEISTSTSTYDALRITHYGLGNGRKRKTDTIALFVAPELEPFSSYEACTPSTVSIGRRWNSIYEEETLLFVPFADDPTFDFEAYAQQYGWFDWLYYEMNEGSDIKYDDWDPDCKSKHHYCRRHSH